MSRILTGKISFFGGPNDPSSGPTTASGASVDVPGIAIYDHSTLGQHWKVTLPNGRVVILPQTDFGPAPWTGRVIDITYSALPLCGYTEFNFPTDAIASAECLDMAKRYVDFAWQKPSVQWLKDNGFSGVIGYISNDASKDLSAAQIANYHTGGMEVALVFETTSSRMRAGYEAGKADAKQAALAAKQRGYPSNGVIFFADDEDNAWSSVEPYMRGVRDYRGSATTGFYGSGDNLRAAKKGGYVRYGWLSVSTGWTGSHDLSGADLHQVAEHAEYDANVALVADWGQWGFGGTFLMALTDQQQQEIYDHVKQVWSEVHQSFTNQHADMLNQLKALKEELDRIAAKVGA